MKKGILFIAVLGLVVQAQGSEVIPPRIVVKCLIKAVQEQKNAVVGWHFKFDETKHDKLTPLSRAEQLALLKDLPLDKLKFDQDEYAVDKGERFVVRLVAPRKLDFEMQYLELKGDKGPPWKFNVVAIKETAQP